MIIRALSEPGVAVLDIKEHISLSEITVIKYSRILIVILY